MPTTHPAIYYQNGPTGVLLFHGFNSSPQVFTDLTNQLSADGYTVLAPVIEGHGSTPENLEKSSHREWFDSAEKAYLHLAEKTQKIYIVGASFGGNLGYYLAAHHPVAGLVTISSPRWLHHHAILKTLSFLAHRVFRLRYFNMKKYKKMQVSGNPLIPIKSFQDFFKVIHHLNTKLLRKITCPTLIIHSNIDGLVSPTSAEHFHKNISSKNKSIFWVNAPHHSLHLGKEKKIICEQISQFIKNT